MASLLSFSYSASSDVLIWGSGTWDQTHWASSTATSQDWDGDGEDNLDDAFPLDPSETMDTDLDGIGNNTQGPAGLCCQGV